jgi:hypothetical protein
MGMKGKIALGAVVGVAVIAVVSTNSGSGTSDGGSDSGSGTGKGSSASAPHGSEGGSKAAATEKKAAFAGDGDFRVGSDIKPGTYRTAGNSDGMCYWERARDAKGEMDSIIANDNVSGTSYVTVKATDRLFKSHGCKDWEAVDAKAKGTPATRMKGDGGMFRVGADIKPGTYRSTGNSDGTCYWERAKDADHTLGSIIANNNVTGTAVVTISSSDGYFKTTGCQDWKKTG